MEAATDDATIKALTEAIEKLESQERALVTLFYYEERSVAECAAIMGQTENNIKVRLHRIRKKLYLLITDREYER
jgi:RNA polymerase sigma-70 factor (ECF subfamily)